MLEIIDRQKLENGLLVITYKTPFFNFWTVVAVKENEFLDESITQLEKMACKIERGIKNKKTGNNYASYVIGVDSRRTYSLLLEDLKAIQRR